ncbi:putative methyltransferase-domain-containing protein [Coniella lustricola]|uniref:Putative methyltransferase-domain-containing protein n=1 Tax=Coniella lustricola TaxID=2025994 RepID=A0A2T3A9E4_9PEZI|nr:putative methyltransferase-domain-containing protein [Coniella lustricola]
MAVSAFDLPQVWQKPTAEELIDALHQLRVDPPVWNLKISRAEIFKHQDTTTQHQREIAAYLSAVIKSELAWIDDDEDKETIWTEASKRFSERCGRSAMGEIVRRWPFESDDYQPFDLIVREPPLTGDNLGLKTWGSSYVLAQMLHTIGETSLSHLLRKDSSRPPVLELGSGTGLLGLAAAATWQTLVILTDLPEIMSNLAYNVSQNRATIEERGGTMKAGALTWGGNGGDEIDPVLFTTKNSFRIIIVADPLYDDVHPGLLAGAIDEQLSYDQEARAMVMVPQRDATTVKLLSAFRLEMGAKATPLVCLEERIVAGQDDWGADDDEEAGHVKCWLGVFGRQQ